MSGLFNQQHSPPDAQASAESAATLEARCRHEQDPRKRRQRKTFERPFKNSNVNTTRAEATRLVIAQGEELVVGTYLLVVARAQGPLGRMLSVLVA